MSRRPVVLWVSALVVVAAAAACESYPQLNRSNYEPDVDIDSIWGEDGGAGAPQDAGAEWVFIDAPAFIDGGGGAGGADGGGGDAGESADAGPDVLEEGICGDTHLNLGEECDDGNPFDGDGCSAECVVEGQGEYDCTNIGVPCIECGNSCV